MARIRDRDTRPERCVRRKLWARGRRFRLRRRLSGVRPDILFSSAKVAVFIDGCFWHGCPLHYAQPRTRKAFWAKKLCDNVSRDIRQTRSLRAAGLTVLRFWTHEVVERPEQVLTDVAAAVSGQVTRHSSSWRVLLVECLENNEELRRLISLDEEQRTERARRNKNSYRRL